MQIRASLPQPGIEHGSDPARSTIRSAFRSTVPPFAAQEDDEVIAHYDGKLEGLESALSTVLQGCHPSVTKG